MSYLILPEVMQTNADDLLKVDVSDPELQKADRHLHIGFTASQQIIREDLEGTHAVTKLRRDVRAFYVASLQYMREKFPMDDHVVQDAKFLDPNHRAEMTPEFLMRFTCRFPGVFSDDLLDALSSEMCDYQCAADLPEVKEDRIDKFWHDMSLIRNAEDNSLRFPQLSKLAKYLLLIPHSNARCETLFNMVNKTATSMRSQLGKGKEGHSRDSVYSTATGIRNTLCAILAAKINIFCNSQCCEWKPSKALQKRAKSATYRNLTARSSSK